MPCRRWEVFRDDYDYIGVIDLGTKGQSSIEGHRKQFKFLR